MLNTINGIAKCKHLMVCESRCINNEISYVTDTGSYMQMKKKYKGSRTNTKPRHKEMCFRILSNVVESSLGETESEAIQYSPRTECHKT